MDYPLHKIRVSIPIHDMYRDGEVAFVLDFYGVPLQQFHMLRLAEKPHDDDKYLGAAPIRAALVKRGFDPNRYQPFLFDTWETQQAGKRKYDGQSGPDHDAAAGERRNGDHAHAAHQGATPHQSVLPSRAPIKGSDGQTWTFGFDRGQNGRDILGGNS